MFEGLGESIDPLSFIVSSSVVKSPSESAGAIVTDESGRNVNDIPYKHQ